MLRAASDRSTAAEMSPLRGLKKRCSAVPAARSDFEYAHAAARGQAARNDGLLRSEGPAAVGITAPVLAGPTKCPQWLLMSANTSASDDGI